VSQKVVKKWSFEGPNPQIGVIWVHFKGPGPEMSRSWVKAAATPAKQQALHSATLLAAEVGVHEAAAASASV
jgi:hypothetical protein